MKVADYFAGLGGFSEGATQAGATVTYAANHWREAVSYHAANHPSTRHRVQDLQKSNHDEIRGCDALLAAPACQGHSSASQPRRGANALAQRATAWAVVEACEVARPRFLIVENVPQFARWELFPVWRAALQALGYRTRTSIIDAAELGTPQNRKRLFLTAALEQTPLDLDTLTRSRPAAASTIIDNNAGGWQPVASKPPKMRERIANGTRNHGAEFLAHSVTNHPGRALSRPIGTITTAPNHWHLVRGDMVRPLTVRELARAQGFPESYKLPAQLALGTKLIGNAVAVPVARAIVAGLIASA